MLDPYVAPGQRGVDRGPPLPEEYSLSILAGSTENKPRSLVLATEPPLLLWGVILGPGPPNPAEAVYGGSARVVARRTGKDLKHLIASSSDQIPTRTSVSMIHPSP